MQEGPAVRCVESLTYGCILNVQSSLAEKEWQLHSNSNIDGHEVQDDDEPSNVGIKGSFMLLTHPSYISRSRFASLFALFNNPDYHLHPPFERKPSLYYTVMTRTTSTGAERKYDNQQPPREFHASDSHSTENHQAPDYLEGNGASTWMERAEKVDEALKVLEGIFRCPEYAMIIYVSNTGI